MTGTAHDDGGRRAVHGDATAGPVQDGRALAELDEGGESGATERRVDLLGPAQVRSLAEQLGLRPTKQWGQNFVIDPNTVRRIVRVADVGPGDTVLEIGPGMGSLTLALLAEAGRVVAVEVDPILADALPQTVSRYAPGRARDLDVLRADALTVELPPRSEPDVLVANLPYNVAVPVLLTTLARVPSIRRVLVMVQLEVAERLAASPGSRTFGVPSLKARWYGTVRPAGTVPRAVFWPVPRVDSGLVALERRVPPPTSASREEVFACIDAAFSQRRKTLRSALASWAGGPVNAETILNAAGVDPGLRGEQLDIGAYAAIAEQRAHRVRS